jgi:PKD repeat protein
MRNSLPPALLAFLACLLAGCSTVPLPKGPPLFAGAGAYMRSVNAPTPAVPGVCVVYCGFPAAFSASLSDGELPVAWHWDLDGLPEDLLFTDGEAHSGAEFTPEATGSYACSVTAVNKNGSASRTFELVVQAPPAPAYAPWAVPQQFEFYAGSSYQLNAEPPDFGGLDQHWRWNLGAAADPPVSTGASPQIVTGPPGVYDGTVEVANAGGTTAFPLHITVLPLVPPELYLPWHAEGKQSPWDGRTGAVVRPQMGNRGGPARRWNWIFRGAGTAPDAQVAAPELTLGAPGTYQCRVTADNAAGGVSLEFTLVVQP